MRVHFPGGRPTLVAYCTASNDKTLSPAELRAEAALFLPDFMIPTEVVFLDRLPVDQNGKLDVSQLPAAKQSSDASGGARQPTGAIETLIAQVWSEVLNIDDINANDNFFELGGHSLMAIRVIARIKKRMKLTIPMTAVFEHPQLSMLARHVEDEIRTQMAARGART